MKTLYAIVLLAFVGLAILGCSESTDQLVAPVEKASALNSGSLDKKGPVINIATGNPAFFYGGKIVVSAFNAKRYEDGSANGQYEFWAHAFDPTLGNKWHGKVISLNVYDGNQAVIGGVETGQYGFPDTYDIFVVVDNGEGINAPPDMRSISIYWAMTIEDAIRVWSMTPDQVISEIAMQWGYNEDEIMIPVEIGNVSVK